ncbi:hypothetical protein [Streptomyces atratus]
MNSVELRYLITGETTRRYGHIVVDEAHRTPHGWAGRDADTALGAGEA